MVAQESVPLEGLYRVNADSSGIQKLLSAPDFAGPAWSRDGTKIGRS
jgi:hypothetical protein